MLRNLAAALCPEACNETMKKAIKILTTPGIGSTLHVVRREPRRAAWLYALNISPMATHRETPATAVDRFRAEVASEDLAQS